MSGRRSGGGGARIARFRATIALVLTAVGLGALLVGCGSGDGPSGGATTHRAEPKIVVSHAILGSVVTELVGDRADVSVLMGSGIDPHDYRPSARDAAAISSADLVVLNGLGLEESLNDAVAAAQDRGVKVFRATDHIDVRYFGEGELPASEADDHSSVDDHGSAEEHGAGAPDPHFWVDPLSMKQVVLALATTLQADLGLDVNAKASELGRQLDDLDGQIRSILEVVPPDQRLLVTGHESMGYFASRYGFVLVGAVIPSLTSQAAPSASGLAELNEKIRRLGVRAVFTEIGTPPDVASAVATETGARLVELTTHTLPADGSYQTFMVELARAVASGLEDTSESR